MRSKPLVLAHRGASARAPANTLAAFALARELGADGIELDVRRTADAALVVHHDAHADDMGLLRHVEFAALRAARPDIPTLAEALDACRGMLVNVELKCLPWEPDADPPERPLVMDTVDEVHACGAHVVISSFDLDAVNAVHALAPELATAWLTMEQALEVTVPLAVANGHRWLHPDVNTVLDAPARLLDDAHAAGLLIDVWTVDDRDDMRRLVDRGVDAIITNVPDVARAVVDR